MAGHRSMSAARPPALETARPAACKPGHAALDRGGRRYPERRRIDAETDRSGTTSGSESRDFAGAQDRACARKLRSWPAVPNITRPVEPQRIGRRQDDARSSPRTRPSVLTWKAPASVRNSPMKPLVPGSPTLAMVNTMNTKRIERHAVNEPAIGGNLARVHAGRRRRRRTGTARPRRARARSSGTSRRRSPAASW